MVSRKQSTHALTVLNRLVQRKPETMHLLHCALQVHLENLAGSAISVAQENGDPIGIALAETLQTREHVPAHVIELVSSIPDQTVALREAAAELNRRQVERARRTSSESEVAGSLNNLSLRLAALGRREEALASIEDAVASYRTLAVGRPDTFLAPLATSVNNLSLRLADLGRREEARKPGGGRHPPDSGGDQTRHLPA
jgi:hypothetical protein